MIFSFIIFSSNVLEVFGFLIIRLPLILRQHLMLHLNFLAVIKPCKE